MWLDQLFEMFDNRIRLNPERLDRVASAYANLTAFIKDDPPLADVYIALFQQGSVAIDTAIKPPKEGDEFDVDAVFLLNIAKRPGDKQTPHEVISWIAERLRKNRHYEGKVHERARCVRIVYAGDFHVDVVPARLVGMRNNCIEVPSKTEGWRRTNPKGYVDWALMTNDVTQGQFVRVVRLIKYWRDVRFGNESKPKSIILTTLLGQHVPRTSTSTAEALVVAMEGLSASLESALFVPTIPNPSLPEENLARDWIPSAFDLFRERFGAATQRARKAYDLARSDRDRSTREWIALFGESFPRLTGRDGKNLNTAVSKAVASVAPSGKVLFRDDEKRGVEIRPHRFYGTENPQTRN